MNISNWRFHNRVFEQLPLAAVLVAICGMSGCGESVVSSESQAPDPVVVDIPVAFIKRQLGEAPIEEDLRNPSAFQPGAALFIKARASASATEFNLTDRAFVEDPDTQLDEQGNFAAPDEGLAYDIKDLEVSYDGTRLLFAMRAPEIEDADDDEQPSWNIWEYHLPSDQLRRIISSDIVAESGQDTGPVYLPDGRIMFSSTRQRGNQAILLDEGKPQYAGLEESLRREASVLHIMDDDGGNITQVSFNQSHDLDPIVMPDGKILFSRWDHAGGNKGIHLYQMNPDGSSLEIVYGRHSHEQNGEQVHFVKARVTPDDCVLVALRPFENTLLGGDYVRIDTAGFTDLETPVADNPSAAGTPQQKALFDNVDTQATLSPGGYFSALYPLWDGSDRQLFSWSQCRVFDPDQVIEEGDTTTERRILPCNEELLARDDVEAAPLLYGLWMFDPQENTQLPIGVPQEGIAYTEVVAMESRPFPANFTGPDSFDGALAELGLGALHIRSVYDFAGMDTSPAGIVTLADPSQTPAEERPVRFVRLVKSVSIPDDDVLDLDNDVFGRGRGQLMREILGYAQVEPDGSANMLVPANVPFAISLLDGRGRRVSERHENWLQVAPGELKTCNGCHSDDSTAPHGRLNAEFPSINNGAPATGSPFPNTNPELFADIGETMAQTATRINGLSYPGPDIEYTDIWTDPAQRAPSEPFSLAYGDMQSPIPVTTSCAQNWTSLCRVVVNFPDHIQPVFDVDRSVLDEQGMLIEDRTCVSCHSPMDADMLVQVPAGQLDLTSNPSTDNADHLTSFRELLFADNEQEVVEGALLDRLVEVTDSDGNSVFETDEEGELILDAEGNPIPVTRTVRVGNSVSTGGALASGRFFSVFDGGSHQGWLSPAELKLLAEWMDVGAQYYNNPFDAPRD